MYANLNIHKIKNKVFKSKKKMNVVNSVRITGLVGSISAFGEPCIM